MSRRAQWYQLPLPLQEDRPGAERRSRLAIELLGRRGSRDQFFEGWEDEFGYPREESRFWPSADEPLRRLAGQIIGESL